MKYNVILKSLMVLISLVLTILIFIIGYISNIYFIVYLLAGGNDYLMISVIFLFHTIIFILITRYLLNFVNNRYGKNIDKIEV